MRIFLRRLLSFWIATVLVTVITGMMIFRAYPPPGGQHRPLPLPTLRACAAAHVRELEGPKAGNKLSGEQVSACEIAYILDRSNPRRFGGPVPANIQSLADSVTLQVPVNLQLTPDRTMVAFGVPGIGADVVAVAMLPDGGERPPSLIRWHLVVTAIVSTFTCAALLVLRRHFVYPIRRLQFTTDSFGHGNLESRPDLSLLNRKDELGDLSNTIAEMSARISALMGVQKNFLVQVSHELGSPLTRLKIALALARRKADPDLLPELDRIQGESSELNSMIQQLLKLARLENGLEEGDKETYSLDRLLVEVCQDAQFISGDMGKHMRYLPLQEISVCGYREIMKRALDNVLRNAIRFTPEGSFVEVDVQCRSGDLCVIRVTDSGVGVPNEKLDAIFEPFVQVSSTTDRAGAGLGLAIAKQGVLANGGTIRALNLKQGGLLIEISLPVVCIDQADASANSVGFVLLPSNSSGRVQG